MLIGGIETTIPLHQRDGAEAPEFINGDYDIHWLERFVGWPRRGRRKIRLTPEILLTAAYAAGVFPMARPRPTIRSCSGSIHHHRGNPARARRVSTSRAGSPACCARGGLEVSCDTAFEEVIRRPAPRRPKSARTPGSTTRSCGFTRPGRARRRAQRRMPPPRPVGRRALRVSIGAAFFGESMFSRETDAEQGGARPHSWRGCGSAATASSTRSS